MKELVEKLKTDAGKVSISYNFGEEKRDLKWFTVSVKEKVKRKGKKVWLEKTHVGFYDEKLVKECKHATLGNIDATYKFKPNIPGCYQLLTFMGTVLNQV